MKTLFRILLVSLIALPLAGCGDEDTGPCPVETVDGNTVMKITFRETGPQKYAAYCSNDETAKDLVVNRGDWLHLTNGLDEDITLKFKKKGMSGTEFWNLFGRNGQVEIPMGETLELQVLADADRETSEYSIISWQYGDPGPTIKVP